MTYPFRTLCVHAFNWQNYSSGVYFDELIANGQPRAIAAPLCQYFANLSPAQLAERQAAAQIAIRTMGITFTVYSEGAMIDRTWPFDIVPRVIGSAEWHKVERGLQQRVTALNRFIHDIYNDQHVFKDNIVPPELILRSVNYRPQCQGIQPAYNVWAHICGSDLVRDETGRWLVLEDNLRIPSGVSYMLENRNVTKRVLPELFQSGHILGVDDYVLRLYDTLSSLSPRAQDEPCIVVLTPGIFNSAYFEHAYLAQQMGVELVQGSDLIVSERDEVFLRSIEGLKRVDVVYRRIDDVYLDPKEFKSDSLLGVPGLMRAWRAGKVALANAPGAGVADDKVVYSYVPDLIRYYLSEEPLLDNVPSYQLTCPTSCQHVAQNLANMVVKPANESGGYGVMIGSKTNQSTRDEYWAKVLKHPRNYVAQPELKLSTAPTMHASRLEPRHIDLRPFVLSSSETYVTKGGLTRVALQPGSLVVNSSQGGGSKDTWVVR